MKPTERITAEHGALLIVDLQEKLLPKIVERDRVVFNCLRLVRGAKLLGLSVNATEQYPKGLGPSVPGLVELIPERGAKTTFHCCSVPSFLEAHVCVAQTGLELMCLGFRVQIVADAVGSRSQLDWEFALRRLERAGAVISTTEAVLFEWAERSDRPEFKAISELIKESQVSTRFGF